MKTLVSTNLMLITILFSLQGCATSKYKIEHDPQGALRGNPSEELQLKVINLHSSAIRFIKNPSETVQLSSVKKNWFNIGQINNPTEKVQLMAVQAHPNAIASIKNPTEKIQLVAVETNLKAMMSIKNPTETVKNYVKVNSFKLDDYHFFLESTNKVYSIWDFETNNTFHTTLPNMPASIEVKILKQVVKAIKISTKQYPKDRYKETADMVRYYHAFAERVRSRHARILVSQQKNKKILKDKDNSNFVIDIFP